MLDAQRLSDKKLIERLREEEFSGPAYSLFESALAEYGMGALAKMITNGSVFVKARRLGHSLPPPLEPIDRDLASELAAEAVANSVVRFRKDAIVGGGWKPDGGASLQTYFLNSCVLSFGNTYRTWQRSVSRERDQSAAARAEYVTVGESYDPIATAENRMFVEQFLDRNASPEMRDLLMMYAGGYTMTEAAKALNIPPRKAENMLRTLRRRLRLEDLHSK